MGDVIAESGMSGVVDAQAGTLSASEKAVNAVHGTFRCRRGYDLHTTAYLPAVRRTDACLVFHHGLADHSERHGEVLAHLCTTLGMPVYAYDAHGHGRSGPAGPVGRALIRSYTHLVDDLLDFIRTFVVQAEQQQSSLDTQGCVADVWGRAAEAPEARGLLSDGQPPRQPQLSQRRKPRIFMLGYSMGGLVSGLAVAETVAAAGGDGSGSSSLVEGLMLTSALTDPLYGNHPVLRAIKVAYVTALSWLTPALPLFKRRPVESGIRDPAGVAAMAMDTLWYRGRFKVATIASLLAGCARLRRIARRLADVPLYVQHATVDVSCSLPSMHAFLARVRPSDLTLHVEEGAYHDLHHDPQTHQLLKRMVEWLKKRL